MSELHQTAKLPADFPISDVGLIARSLRELGDWVAHNCGSIAFPKEED